MTTASNTALFFQIATGLIPILLVAGGLTNAAGRNVGRHGRLWIRVGLSCLVVVVVLAEFIAIKEAVAADLTPAAWRTVFVAEVLVLETVLLGVGFLLPWFENLHQKARTVLLGVGGLFALAVFSYGGLVLSDTVNTAALRRDAAVAHCVRRFQVEETTLSSSRGID